MTTHSLENLTELTIGDIEPHGVDSRNDHTVDILDLSNSWHPDDVVRLRQWGTHRIFPLRRPRDRNKSTDRSSTRKLQASSQHASRSIEGIELYHDGQSWRLRDGAGVANLKQDGAPAREVALIAGTEVSVAGSTLIAESPRTLRLRNLCSRLLGWSDDRLAAVDQALRTIRLASSGMIALVLRGSGDTVPIADAIHKHVLGRDAPFLVSDPYREDIHATARSPANYKIGMEAFREASGGTLCVRAESLPMDFNKILNSFRVPYNDVRLTVCLSRLTRRIYSLEVAPIDIPPLETRREELDRIVSEYAEDIIDSMRIFSNCLSSRDIEWVSQLPNLTLSEIERSLQRVAAINASHSLSGAADRLGMAPVSLTRWLDRRRELSTSSALYINGLMKRKARSRTHDQA